MKRFLTLAMVLCILLGTVSCAASKETGKDQKETSAATDAVTTESVIPDDNYEPDSLPEKMDFGGETVTFFSIGDSASGWFDDEITVEELTNEVLNDSIYNRERFVEDRLNVEIEVVNNDGGFDARVFQLMNSGDDDYQILCQRTLYLSNFILEGYLADLYEQQYLDFTKPWWSQKFIDKAELMDRLYIATGSLSLSLKRFLFAVYYNKKVAEDFSANIPELADLYEIVESGKWTFDKFYELGSGIYVDLNGDSEADAEDIFGIGCGAGISVDVMWSTFDLSVFKRNDDGWFDFDLNVEKLDDCVSKFHKLLKETKGSYNPGGWDNDLDVLDTKIADDTLLFSINRIMAIESETLRNMQSEYGILPTPKYDEHQEDYYSYAHDQYTSYAIPITCVNKDCASAVLEAMASYSYRYTEPAYLDMALKGKYLNDMQSRRMIDIVIDGFKVDSSWIYLYNIGIKFPAECRDIVGSGTKVASSIASNSKKVKSMLPIFQRQFMEKNNID